MPAPLNQIKQIFKVIFDDALIRENIMREFIMKTGQVLLETSGLKIDNRTIAREMICLRGLMHQTAVAVNPGMGKRRFRIAEIMGTSRRPDEERVWPDALD